MIAIIYKFQARREIEAFYARCSAQNMQCIKQVLREHDVNLLAIVQILFTDQVVFSDTSHTDSSFKQCL